MLRALPVPDTVAFFRDLGVALHEEAGGKLFPDTNRARDVLDALLRETARVGATVVAGHRVLDIERTADGFRVVTDRGDLRAAFVVLATGGLSLPKSGSDGAGLAIAERLGHTIVPTTPALDPLVLAREDRVHADLSGVSQDVELAVWIDGAIAIRVSGALLWTHVGASGPVALDASRHWLRARRDGRAVSITANLRPGHRFDGVEAEWIALARDRPTSRVQTTLAAMVPASAAAVFLRELGIDGRVSLAHFGREDRRRLSRALVEWPLPVVATRGYTFAEATAGGVALTEIDPATMESRVCPRLFLVGEMLDVDGRLGGFNFQWAWSSGFVAGRGLGAAANTE